ncbi:MAG: aminoglycoside phosphotransferase family protein [Corynebacteriales bacterium]|nr:aminoglycoside phosphotransferase family protein [Mycobacteriales bacterium]
MSADVELGMKLLRAALGGSVTRNVASRVELAERIVFDAFDEAGGHYIVKVDSDWRRISDEVDAMRYVRTVVPAPEFVAADETSLAYRYVDGTPLTEVNDADAWRNAGETLAKLHALPADCPEEHRLNWGAHFLGGALEETTRIGSLLTETQRQRFVDYFTGGLAGLQLDVCVSLHGDCQAEHVIIDAAGGVAALLDFADFGCGDALVDLCALTAWHPHQLNAVLDGYQPSAQLLARVDRYRHAYWARRHLGVARWRAEQNLPYHDALNAALKFATPDPS